MSHEASSLERVPEQRAERWVLVQECLETWFDEEVAGLSETTVSAGEKSLSLRLPPALREWYRRFGANLSHWSMQDDMLQPGELRIQNDHLVIMRECQAAVTWGIPLGRLGEDDPPVDVTSVDEPSRWLEESDSVSLFALGVLLSSVKTSRRRLWWGNARLERSRAQAFVACYPTLAVVRRNDMAPAHFHGYRDLVIEQQLLGDHEWIYASARTADERDELDRTARSLRIEWDSTASEWPAGWVSR